MHWHLIVIVCRPLELISARSSKTVGDYQEIVTRTWPKMNTCNLVNSPMRVDARSCMNVFQQVMGSIIGDSRCGMDDVAFALSHQLGSFLVI